MFILKRWVLINTFFTFFMYDFLFVGICYCFDFLDIIDRITKMQLIARVREYRSGLVNWSPHYITGLYLPYTHFHTRASKLVLINRSFRRQIL